MPFSASPTSVYYREHAQVPAPVLAAPLARGGCSVRSMPEVPSFSLWDERPPKLSLNGLRPVPRVPPCSYSRRRARSVAFSFCSSCREADPTTRRKLLHGRDTERLSDNAESCFSTSVTTSSAARMFIAARRGCSSSSRAYTFRVRIGAMCVRSKVSSHVCPLFDHGAVEGVSSKSCVCRSPFPSGVTTASRCAIGSIAPPNTKMVKAAMMSVVCSTSSSACSSPNWPCS
mmetsp:Transcript_13978/g.36272  ORF Transcript_13978/g.36272 Transcript_13978/m.36272 type:complete len:230 (-) Transcript_13978:62-751(-)